MNVIVNQEGRVLSQRDISNEIVQGYQTLIESKREEFELALEARCQSDNEVFNKLGVIPEVGHPVYQVGMRLFSIIPTESGVKPVCVGQVG